MKQKRLPLFPLARVLYPEERLALHIFEDRYRRMIRICQDEDIPFGVVLIRDDRLAEVGCMAEISRIEKSYEDGRSDIQVQGTGRFRILTVNREDVFMSADVDSVRDEVQVVDIPLRERVVALHIKLLELAGRMPSLSMYQDRAYLSFFVGHNAGLDLSQKQEVLEMTGEGDRLSYLASHLEKLIPLVESAEHVRKKISSNGHFQDFPPPDDDRAD